MSGVFCLPMPEEKHEPEVTRPIVLHVERIDFNVPTMEHIRRRRVTALDLEMSIQDAQKLAEYLIARANRDTPGAVRIRLYGHLVIS